MSEELKLCLFCGGEAKIEKWDSERWFAHCPRCNIYTTPYNKRDNAIFAWNRRPTQKPEALTLEQLREAEKSGTAIYVCRTENSSIFRDNRYTAAVLDTTWVAGIQTPQLVAIYGRGLTLPEDEYGKTWFAYTERPYPTETGGSRDERGNLH